MDNDNFPISGNELSSELIGLNKGSDTQKIKLIAAILGITIFLVVIIIIVIAITQKRDKKSEKNSPKEVLARIYSIYDAQTTSLEVPLLSEEFDKKFDFDILINNEKIKYSKKYKFSSMGYNIVTFEIYEKMNIDKMFKGVYDIVSVEMKSEKQCELTSMISAFEKCERLAKFRITGFETSQLISTKALFNGCISLTDIDITDLNTMNVKDMSYMFSGTIISEIDLSLMDTSNVEDMSHMFTYQL